MSIFEFFFGGKVFSRSFRARFSASFFLEVQTKEKKREERRRVGEGERERVGRKVKKTRALYEFLPGAGRKFPCSPTLARSCFCSHHRRKKNINEKRHALLQHVVLLLGPVSFDRGDRLAVFASIRIGVVVGGRERRGRREV